MSVKYFFMTTFVIVMTSLLMTLYKNAFRIRMKRNLNIANLEIHTSTEQAKNYNN